MMWPVQAPSALVASLLTSGTLVQIHLHVAGEAGAAEVWFDGSRIDDLSKSELLGITPASVGFSLARTRADAATM